MTFYFIINILYEIIYFINPYFKYNNYIINNNLINSFDDLSKMVFCEWTKYKNIKSFNIDNNINKYLENNNKKNTFPNEFSKNHFLSNKNFLNINIKFNEHFEELDENIIKQYCIDILPYSKLNNYKHLFIFTDGSSSHSGNLYKGGSGLILLNPKTNIINCFALKCKNCDSISSEYNPIVFLIDNWFKFIPNDMHKIVIFCDNIGVVKNIKNIFFILHHNLFYNNIDLCSIYSFKNIHEKWCKKMLLSFNKYSKYEKHIIISKLQLFWIKAHTMFLWNILADAISKWSRIYFI